MDFQNRNNQGNKYVCPSDRQLSLRAKLQTGWSTGKPGSPLLPEERAAILSVVRRNEDLESAERQRVGRLVERLEKIKLRAAECGPHCCRLCGQTFGLLGPSKITCSGCQKSVCSKCSIEITEGHREFSLCKICSETREMWKKSGAWFFKGLPRYEIPTKTQSARNSFREQNSSNAAQPDASTKNRKTGTIHVEDTSSEEDGDETERQNNVNNSVPRSESFRLRTVGSFRSFFDGERKFSASTFFCRQSSNPNDQNVLDWDSVSMVSSLAAAATAAANRRESQNLRRGSVSSSWSVSESSSGNSNSGNNCLGQVCREPPLGWLELNLNYSEANHTLECSVLRARDLPEMDSAGLADPFCKLNIITAEATTKQARWLRTKTVHKTRNPEFNELVTFIGVEPEELGNSILYVVVLDDDKYGHDFLGASKVGLSTIYQTSPYRLTVPLGAEDQYSIEAGTSGPWPRGQILVALSYNTKKRVLAVIIKRCTNLVPMDNNGSSDPFVKLQLKPDFHHRKKFKTSIKWHNLNPIFNEEFQFEARPHDLDKQSLVITVWDKDIGKSNDFLGSLVLGHNSKGKRLKQWTDCLRLPDHFHEQWHCLSSDSPSH